MKSFLGFPMFAFGLVGALGSLEHDKSIWLVMLFCGLLGWGLDLIIEGHIDTAKKEMGKKIDELRDSLE